MLVGIQVSGVLSKQLAERLELARGLVGNRVFIVSDDNLVKRDPLLIPIDPFGQVQVQTHAEARVSGGIISSRFGSRPADHQAGAGNDTTLLRADDALVDAGAQPEVIGVDSEMAEVHQTRTKGRAKEGFRTTFLFLNRWRVKALNRRIVKA